MDSLRLIAILGGSGSGKSALGLKLAEKLDCEIFSLDSLAIYQDFNIVSAKPTHKELSQIHHYGINVLKPNEKNNAMLFRNLLLEAMNSSKQKGKNTLLIIGGSSFYLKSMIDGLSPHPQLSINQSQDIAQKIKSLTDPYQFLQHIDKDYDIHPNDTYRLHKALEIYFATQMPPTQYFAKHPRESFPYKLEKYAINLARPTLRERIAQRTETMLKNGLLDEISYIFEKYDYTIQPSSAIGVKESIEYLTQTPLELLQGKTPPSNPNIAKNTQELCTLISTHTAQLAKRQSTFNRTQFGEIHFPSPAHKKKEGIVFGDFDEIFEAIIKNA